MGNYYILAGTLCVAAAMAFIIFAVVWVKNRKKDLERKWKD